MSNFYGARFGAMDIRNHRIDFVRKLDVAEGVMGGIPRLMDIRLYIRDSENVLLFLKSYKKHTRLLQLKAESVNSGARPSITG